MTLAQFIAENKGKKLDWDGAYGGQCVDLFRFYVHKVLKLKQPRGVVGANDFWLNYSSDPILKENFKRITNTATFKPIAGDVMIWNKKAGNGFGHVAVVADNTATTSHFWSFDQNWRAINVCELTKHDYTNVYGVLRPVSSTQEPMQEDALKSCLAQHKQLVDELEAEKRKNKSLLEEVEKKNELIKDLEGALVEKTSVLQSTKEDLKLFIENLATKLSSIADRNAILGTVERLIANETELERQKRVLEKKLLEKSQEFEAERNTLVDEIQSLKADLVQVQQRAEQLEKKASQLEDKKDQVKTFIESLLGLLKRK